MKPGFPFALRARLAVLGVGFLCLAAGCKASQLNVDATKVALLYDEPVGCENLGVVIGRGGGLAGAYSKPSINRESAENEARNAAAELGATHLLVHPEQVEQGDGRDNDYKDPSPTMEMAHGSGTGSTITVAGTAYKCAVSMPQTKSELMVRGGTTFEAVPAPSSISLVPLGTLQSVSVFHLVPESSGGTRQTEVLAVEDLGQVQRVADSLRRAVEDPLKYIPTHRVQITGSLGTQSFLYGFGYVQYAGKVYRLTDGVFEEVLNLREDPQETGVEIEMRPTDSTRAE